jgi:hypothetical protein
MKTFYTERDIADLHAAGVREIEVNDDVVLTDLAREKVAALGISLKVVEACGCALQPAPPPAPTAPTLDRAKLVSQVKARVMARLGTTAYNGLLDQVIPQVVAQLTSDHPQPASPPTPPKTGGY